MKTIYKITYDPHIDLWYVSPYNDTGRGKISSFKSVSSFKTEAEALDYVQKCIKQHELWEEREKLRVEYWYP